MSQHTPSPWTVSGQLIVGPPEPYPNPKAQTMGRKIAEICWDWDGDQGATGELPWSIAKRNGDLLAAAPELLAALEPLLDWCREHTSPIQPNSPHDLLVAANHAIQKAKGKSSE